MGMHGKNILGEAAAGGTIYYCIELLWRGWSHPVMIPVAAGCCASIAAINRAGRRAGLRFGMRVAASTAAILAIELASGIVINRMLDMAVWDYSAMPFNLLGQICPLYGALWVPLAGTMMLIDDAVCGRMKRGRHAKRAKLRT